MDVELSPAAAAMVEAAQSPPTVASRLAGLAGGVIGGIGGAITAPFRALGEQYQIGTEAARLRNDQARAQLEQMAIERDAAMRRAQLEAAQFPAQQAAAEAQAAFQRDVSSQAASATDQRLRQSLLRGAATGTFRPYEIEPGPAELAAHEMVLGLTRDQARAALEDRNARSRLELEARLQRQTTRERLGGEFELERAKRSLGPKAADLTDVAGIRKEFTSASKDYATVRDATARIQAASQDPSPAGDLALIFSFMRALDPGSTVREGEFANAQNAASVPERIRGLYNRVANGERLTEDQRADFLQQGMTLYQATEQTHQATRAQFSEIAKRSGIDPRDVVDAVPGLPAPKAPRKTIGGHEYEKVDGGWKLVGK